MNSSELFICDHNKIEERLASLRKTGASEWSLFYQDDTTNEQWELTQYHSEYHGGGVPVLKRLPIVSNDELITIAIGSLIKNDIAGASLELAEREKTNNEDFREKLITKLMELASGKLSDFDKERLRIIIYESELFDATNRRPIIGKHWIEIEADAKYYQDVAAKANEILNKIGKRKTH